jgi:hypothetical protein
LDFDFRGLVHDGLRCFDVGHVGPCQNYLVFDFIGLVHAGPGCFDVEMSRTNSN